MSLVEQTFQKFVENTKIKTTKICIAVSGGVDSCVLLHLSYKNLSPQNICVFHLDHQTRETSQEDFKFVQNLCSNYGVSFYGKVLKKNTTKNKEDFWRKERHRASQECAKNFGAKKVITAHHATDLIETMIFRLTKGAGASGLSPFETSTKPFWNIPKSELIKYAQKNDLEWKEDESNFDTTYERNLIRQEVIPHLRKITPNLEKVFIHEAILFGAMNDFLAQEIQKLPKPILLDDFLLLPEILQHEFFRINAQKTCRFTEIEDALKWLKQNPKGNSQKIVGKTPFRYQQKKIWW